MDRLIDSIRQAIPIPEGMNFRGIEAVLTYLAEQSKEGRLLIILDEFPYWVTGDKAIPSKVQRFWNRIGQHSNLMLVLCGSSISMMMDYVLAERAPLYGPRTGQLELNPFDYRTTSEFFPKWSAPRKDLGLWRSRRHSCLLTGALFFGSLSSPRSSFGTASRVL